MAGGAARAGDCAGLKGKAPPDAEITAATLQPAGPSSGGTTKGPAGWSVAAVISASGGALPFNPAQSPALAAPPAMRASASPVQNGAKCLVLIVHLPGWAPA